MAMIAFKGKIEIIGVNPYVHPPQEVLVEIFRQAGRDKGPIPIRGKINGKPYKQTLVKFKGAWRFYINTTMIKDSPKRVGEIVELKISFDPDNREIKPPVNFLKALGANQHAGKVFNNLPASKKLEIVRYLANLKSKEALDRNIKRAVSFLLGHERFVGRDKP